VRGFLFGGLVLIALGRILPDPDAPSRVATLLSVPAELARRFLDPNVPAIGAARRKRLNISDRLPPIDAAEQPTTPPIAGVPDRNQAKPDADPLTRPDVADALAQLTMNRR
jgi:hypothetical protein